MKRMTLWLVGVSAQIDDRYRAIPQLCVTRFFCHLIAGISLPEGVDPSFLAALPEDIRREVLQNQLGIRPPSRPPVTSTLTPSASTVLGGGPGVTEVSPEFLAALPPAIQEEV